MLLVFFISIVVFNVRNSNCIHVQLKISKALFEGQRRVRLIIHECYVESEGLSSGRPSPVLAVAIDTGKRRLRNS